MSDKLHELGVLLPLSMCVAGSMAKKPKVNIHLSVSHYRHLRLNGSILDSTAAGFYDYNKNEYNLILFNLISWNYSFYHFVFYPLKYSTLKYFNIFSFLILLCCCVVVVFVNEIVSRLDESINIV